MKTLFERMSEAAQSVSPSPEQLSELEWRCFHCDEVFTNRKLAEDHFGQVTLHPAACVDPLRDDERGMRERAMFYERSWREALQQRNEAADALESAQAEIARVTTALETAAVIFEEYGRLHRKKETADGNLKAERNEQYAAEMRAALKPGQ